MKIIITILILIGISFSIDYKTYAENNINTKTIIVGPRSVPPTREYINDMKYTRDKDFKIEKKEIEKKEKGFFETIWEWILNLFGF